MYGQKLRREYEEAQKDEKVHRTYCDSNYTSCGRLIWNVGRKTMGAYRDYMRGLQGTSVIIR